MRWRNGWILFAFGLLIYGGMAVLQRTPGYMDAEYYYVGGRVLAEGHGFWEPFLWNYLDEPAGLPHPAFTYWMPLPALVAMSGMRLAGDVAFLWARLPFVILAALTVPLTAWLAGRLRGDLKSGKTEWLAGGLALFGGFYLIYNSLTETFVLYFLLGALFLACAFEELTPGLGFWRGAVLGVLAALMHLTRADGLLWLVAGAAVLIWQSRGWRLRLLGVVGLLLVYGLVMSPWMGRNLAYYGRLMAPGGMRTLWLTDYNQTYAYPASVLTLQHWLDSGWRAIVSARWWALQMNLKTTLGVQGSVFLLPLMVVGLWRQRRKAWAQFVAVMWLMTLAVMTVVFPFAGARGGFFHSGAALQACLWAVVPQGLEQTLAWVSRLRGWSRKQAGRVFSVGLVGLAFVFSVLVVNQQVVGVGLEGVDWERSWQAHAALRDVEAPMDAVFMVNNPPGFYAVTGRPAIVIPDGDVVTVMAVARQYRATYLVLDQNAPAGLRDLYREPRDEGGLMYWKTIAGQHIFKIVLREP